MYLDRHSEDSLEEDSRQSQRGLPDKSIIALPNRQVKKSKTMAGSPLLGVSFSSAFIFVAQKRPHGARTACDDDISIYTRLDRRYL
jgi:hypothetical protein